MSKLLSPYTINGLTLKNRVVMSPMCMYSCTNRDGAVMDWHKIHYASRAVGQVGLIIVEATAVTPQGRISNEDLGIWDDEHIEGLKDLVSLCKPYGTKMGIQLAHAGRKSQADGEIIAPSALAFNENYRLPNEMNLSEIHETILAFKAAAIRAKTAGFDVIEIHAAHGYLINQFLSPLTNHRSDEYGGDREQRYRFLSEIIKEIRLIWSGSLFVRISANDYHPNGLTLDDYVFYAKKMRQDGVDLIDVSSGAVVPASIHTYPGYQVPFADRIRSEAHIATGAVGLITSPQHAEEIIQNERADLVFLGRELLRDPYWLRTAAQELNISIEKVKQYERGW